MKSSDFYNTLTTQKKLMKNKLLSQFENGLISVQFPASLCINEALATFSFIGRPFYVLLISLRSRLLVHHSPSCPGCIRLAWERRNANPAGTNYMAKFTCREVAKEEGTNRHLNDRPAKWPTRFAFLVVTTLPLQIYHLFTTHFCASKRLASQEREELFQPRGARYARSSTHAWGSNTTRFHSCVTWSI